VIPAHLAGTFDAMPPGARRIRLRPIRVTYGEPMDFSALLKELDGESKKKDVYQRISQEIMDRIAALEGIASPSTA
jgi:1-acyl-sn-glycerol-3-phosphate acyltransferase